jgi:hypothetical protein
VSRADGPEACVPRASRRPRARGQPQPSATTDANATDEPMNVLFFESAAVAADMRGHVLIAFFDGSIEDQTQQPKLVTMLRCTNETARALRSAIGSALPRND